ncbi:hypothetical protein PQX77_018745 [Marasmius sp. AFHP31]|nr:hypothetical protein PQX77_018745 [Marasmius sp. AFHP31]
MLRHTTDTAGGFSARRSPACCQVLRRHMTHDGTNDQQPTYYWQLQYYDDIPDACSSSYKSSAYAQSVQEQNAIFYATFPDARPSVGESSMELCSIPDNNYHHGNGFYHPDSTSSRGPKPDLSIQTEGISTASSLTHHHATNRSNPCSSTPADSFVQNPIGQTDNAFTERSPHWADGESVGDMTPLTTYADDDPVSNANDHDIPTDSEDSYDGDHRGRSYERLSPPRHLSTSLDERNLSTTTSRGEGGGSMQDLDLTPSEATGTWPSLRVRRHDSVSSSPSGASDDRGQSGHTLTTYGRRATIIPPLSPRSTSASTPSSTRSSQEQQDGSDTVPSLMRISPLPSHRRPVEKKKTQTLACNFCRGRKVALTS